MSMGCRGDVFYEEEISFLRKIICFNSCVCNGASYCDTIGTGFCRLAIRLIK